MDIQLESGKGKTLSVFTLVMINVIAIDNLRSLTAGAMYGFSLIFFYILAAVLFFIPTILVTAELATGWPNTGGVYIWVREAFGPRWGFLTIWLQWIYNVVWYPTIFAFMGGILAYLIYPPLVDNKYFMLGVVICAFWSTTLINFCGLKVSSWVSIIGAITGTIFPMVLIAILSFIWIYLGKPSQIHFSLNNLLPDYMSWQNVAFLTNILFGLMGMEMSAVHAGDVHHPQRDYPRALLISAIIILITLLFSCMAIAIVIPVQQLNLVSGLIDAFGLFFKAYHLDWLIPVIAMFIIIGSLSGATAWILGPARGLCIAAEDGHLPRFLTKQNKQKMPIGILLTQGVIVTIICIVFLIMPTVNSSYWVLSNLTAQLALLFYILFFASAIRLRYKHAHIERAYQIPGGLRGIWLVCGLGIITCISAIIVGFIPPANMRKEGIIQYEAILIIGILVFCLFPMVLYYARKKRLTSLHYPTKAGQHIK
jgi:putative glutamate/gamma-aminobutyrate antiporter